ncbi:MAG: hypothetical protein ACXVQJ_05010 [Actinomycetota bacterium]
MAVMRSPGGLRTQWVWRPVLTALLAVGLVPGAVLRLPSAPPGDQVWMATSTTIGRIQRYDPGVAKLFFDRSASYGLNGGWNSATPAFAWASEAAFERDLRRDRIAPEITTVMYDPENWDATPLTEQQHPIEAMQAFASAARSAGYRVVLTPHPNLVEVPGAECPAQPNETIQAAFLRCGIVAAAAQQADVVEIQTQFLEAHTATYAASVRWLTFQARAANPDVVVLAGLSTRFTLDARTLLTAWEAVRNVVDGHYLAIPEGIHPSVAVRFLELVAQTG